MTRTLLGAVVVGAVSAVAGVVAGLTVGQPQSERVERVWKAPPTLVAVPLVLTDIPVGTKITAENARELFELRQVPKAEVPPDALLKVEDLIDRRAMRTLHPGEVVNASDLHRKFNCVWTDGDVLMTVPVTISPREVGFQRPGYKVVVVVTKRSEAKGKEVVLPLIVDALILEAEPQKPGVDERQVSFAVTPEQSLWLAAAVESRATIRVELPVNSDRASYETDTRIVLPLAQSLDDVRAFSERE